MGSDMYLRDLYLPTGTCVDLAAAKTTVTVLCRNATVDDLRILLDEDWISDDSPIDPEDWTEENLTRHAATLRAAAEHRLHRLLDEFAASLTGRDVARFRFDNPADTDDGSGGVDAYVTGGVSAGGGPTDAYDAWDIVLDTDRFPDGWCDRIGAACELLHPHGDGPAAATVTLHRWTTPPVDEATTP
ncbi:hypothetical protein [Dactylosporangium sp. CA-092794]|uniref:hypothetical protein n=1 Tax=Dactylosporangium sp. CA-092794 TaxID=3239929 RepID=UPI003D89B0C7